MPKTRTDSRVPVIEHADELNIPWHTLQTIIAGRSLIDTFELHIDSLQQAECFLRAYGFEQGDEPEVLRDLALQYIDTVLLRESRLRLPDAMRQLNLAELLVAASVDGNQQISEWACVILKVCHAVAHAPWTRDEEAYRAALARVKARLEPYLIETSAGTWIGDERCRIPVVEFRIKSEKQFFRLVNELLLKEGNLSADIFDHIGMRFVTPDIFSAILLIRFLRSRHVFMYANVLPQQSKNSLAEFQQIERLFSDFSDPVLDGMTKVNQTAWPGSDNSYSSRHFRMIKIVERMLVSTSAGRKVFFPCEIQILTQQTFTSLQRDRLSHSAYERRQVKGVRRACCAAHRCGMRRVDELRRFRH
jgi:uncharacterized protein (TIGR04562 family)